MYMNLTVLTMTVIMPRVKMTARLSLSRSCVNRRLFSMEKGKTSTAEVHKSAQEALGKVCVHIWALHISRNSSPTTLRTQVSFCRCGLVKAEHFC